MHRRRRRQRGHEGGGHHPQHRHGGQLPCVPAQEELAGRCFFFAPACSAERWLTLGTSARAERPQALHQEHHGPRLPYLRFLSDSMAASLALARSRGCTIRSETRTTAGPMGAGEISCSSQYGNPFAPQIHQRSTHSGACVQCCARYTQTQAPVCRVETLPPARGAHACSAAKHTCTGVVGQRIVLVRKSRNAAYVKHKKREGRSSISLLRRAQTRSAEWLWRKEVNKDETQARGPLLK